MPIEVDETTVSGPCQHQVSSRKDACVSTLPEDTYAYRVYCDKGKVVCECKVTNHYCKLNTDGSYEDWQSITTTTYRTERNCDDGYPVYQCEFSVDNKAGKKTYKKSTKKIKKDDPTDDPSHKAEDDFNSAEREYSKDHPQQK